MVIDAINTVPKSIKLYNRKTGDYIEVSGTKAYVGAGPTNPFFQDFETNERRYSTLKDCENCAKIMDALPEFDFLMSLSDPCDCPPELKDLYSLQAMLEYSDKPICSLPTNRHTMQEQGEMIKALYGSMEAFAEKPSIIMLSGLLSRFSRTL